MSITLFIIFTLLQTGDAVSTYYALKRPGVIEDYRVTKWLQGKVGIIPAMALFTILFVCLVAALLYFANLYQIGWIAQIAVAGLCIQRAWTVYGNWKNTK